jgi:hypothetical protein
MAPSFEKQLDAIMLTVFAASDWGSHVNIHCQSKLYIRIIDLRLGQGGGIAVPASHAY